MHDLIVVGAGPAGMTAATEAADAGLKVLLLDEQPVSGGQIYRNVLTTCTNRPADAQLLGPDYTCGAKLVERLLSSPVEYVPGARVWYAEPRRFRVYYSVRNEARVAEARRIVLAHGAMERPVPIAGWTLPGVMGAGAAQLLLKSAGSIPSGAVVLAGGGPLLLLAAVQLAHAGGRIALLAEVTRPVDYLRASIAFGGALRAPEYLRKGFALLREIRRLRIPRITGLDAVVAEGSSRLERVRLIYGGRERCIDAEMLLLHEGVVPATELTRMLGLQHEYDAAQDTHRPRIDESGASSEEGIFVVGDGAGILGARAAQLRAQLCVARLRGEWRTKKTNDLLNRMRREQAARRFLDALYRPRLARRSLEASDTVVCRCHEVRVSQILAACDQPFCTTDYVKAITRAGMGPCQGRMCAASIARLVAKATGREIVDVPSQRVRPPLKPITLGELASLRNV